MIRVTWRGAVEVGGKDAGGLDMFCMTKVNILFFKVVSMVLASSNLAFPEAVTRTGWMPSSSDSAS